MQATQEIINAVSIPVMAKCRIGHFVEAQILQHLGVDCVDESEVLTVADEGNHVNKTKFKAPCAPARPGRQHNLCSLMGSPLKRAEPVIWAIVGLPTRRNERRQRR